MNFLLADTFSDSLAKLTGDEQKQVKTTAFDLQMNPAHPSLQFHRIEKSRDKNFWSVRVSRDIRIVVHKTEENFVLCYVAHHDDAYSWAERRKMETHPRTGAAQLVEIRETIREIVVPKVVEAPPSPAAKKEFFSSFSNEDLLIYGIPEEWLSDLRDADEDGLLVIAEHLPKEAVEAVLAIASGEQPERPLQGDAVEGPFKHPDAKRRFRVMANAEELKLALEYPWDKWILFLHPAQEHFVTSDFSGPARISGSAGTGKTIVALHRAVQLARRNPETTVLLTTFSEILANSLRHLLVRLIHNEPRLSERVIVESISQLGYRLYASQIGNFQVAEDTQILEMIRAIAKNAPNQPFSERFIFDEWRYVVDAWQLESWDDYRTAKRLGRKSRLSEGRRRLLWSFFQEVHKRLEEENLLTESQLFARLTKGCENRKHPLFDHVVVDESQDLTLSQLRFLASIGNRRPNSLFFAGDLGQRIFHIPFSWKSMGVDIRGRSRTLRINYRTSHQIRMHADRLLDAEVADIDGNVESRKGIVSLFSGPEPEVKIQKSREEEIQTVADWLKARLAEGTLPKELGIFVRSEKQLDRAEKAVRNTGVSYQILDTTLNGRSDVATLGTMHIAKGLEFRAVVVMSCDDEVIPLQSRIDHIGDEADLEEIYATERHLLYVACTRARDRLLVTGVSPESEFLDDLVFNRRE